MKVNKKIVGIATAAVLAVGGTTYALNQPVVHNSTVKEEQQQTANPTTTTDTQAGTQTDTTSQTSTSTNSPATTQTTTQSAEPTPAAPEPAPTVVSQNVRWVVDTSQPQSFIWYCDRNWSDGSTTTIKLGNATEYGNSTGVPKMKYNCPAI